MENKRFIISGTDTDVGKTVFSAALMLGLESARAKPHYWKPLQSGVDQVTDTKHVQRLTNMRADRFLEEGYVFTQPLSPHRASEIDGINIDIRQLRDISHLANCDGYVVIEGAGGLMVPITRAVLQLDLYKDWGLPVILCARTGLGTINHTLLSIEALNSRRIPLAGIAFVGEMNRDNINTIGDMSGVRVLGCLPHIETLSAETLRDSFNEHFNIQDFL